MRIYIGNLPYLTTEEALETLFSRFGPVKSAKIVIDGHMGRPLGFGFVEMSEEGQAREAIAALHASLYEGSILVVNEARIQRNCETCGNRRSGGRS